MSLRPDHAPKPPRLPEVPENSQDVEDSEPIDSFRPESPGDRVFVGLSGRQEQALLLLASGHAQTYVAEQVGVSRRTIYTWMNLDDQFQNCYEVLRGRIYEQNFERVGLVAGLALERLAELINSDDERISLDAVKTALAAGKHL